MKRALSQIAALLASLTALFVVLPGAGAWALAELPKLATLTAAAVLLGWLPGLALLALLWPRSAALPALERAALGVCLSVALPPILLLLVRLVGLRWGPFATGLYVIACAAVVLAPLLRRARERSIRAPGWAAIALLALVAAIALARVHLVRDLPSGLFGDSYHHTLITQLLIDNGGLFSSWEPYAPLTTFTYHFGFHSNAAFLTWLTGIAPIQSTLLTGQLHSAGALAGAFALGSALTRAGRDDAASTQRAAFVGLIAAAIVGFVNPMPAYFVNWGRYTQQAGQLLMPGLIVCWCGLIDAASAELRRISLKWLGLCALVTTGLMLTHYVVTIFSALAIAVYFVYRVAAGGRWTIALATLSYCLMAAFGALVLYSPWLANTLTGNLTRNVNGIASGGVAADIISQYAALRPITPFYVNTIVMALSAFGAVLALARREWRIALLAIWSALIVALITPGTFGLPGTGIIDHLTAYIALYVTLGPLAAYAIGATALWAAERARIDGRVVGAALAAGLVGVGVWGATWQRNVVNTQAHQLLTPADAAAMAWVRGNTPATARFLVAACPCFGAGELLTGTDAGWWLAYVTGRESTLPPITYGSERGVSDRPEVRAGIVGLWERLRGKPMRERGAVLVDVTQPDGVAALRDNGVTHIYDGAGTPPDPLTADAVNIDALKASPAFELIYDQDGVRIFRLR
jgi:hypothetical protein